MDTVIKMAWIPIGEDDSDCVWIENEDERKEREAEEEDKDTPIETEEGVENETDKENK